MLKTTHQDAQHQQQQQQQQRRSRARSASSLVALLLALQGRKVTLELRNDVMVSGRLTHVDEGMSVFVEDALWQPVTGPATMYPVLFVRGKTLRMVHLPRGLDAAATMQHYVEGLKKQRVAAALDMLNKRHERLAKGVGAAEPDAGAEPAAEAGEAAASSMAASSSAAAGGEAAAGEGQPRSW